METTLDYKFWVSLSTRKFDHKPDRNTEVGSLSFRRIYTDVEGFAAGIAKGYCYTPIFSDAVLSMRNKTDDNFRYSSFISIDIDHSQVEMNTMVDGLVYKPTIAYTSCSNGLDGKYSYRLIYSFREKIEGCNEYYNYVYTLLEANKISIDEIDKRSLKASQYYNGNGCGNINVIISNIIYNKTDFIEYYKDYYINNTSNSNESININHIQSHPTIMSYDDTFENKQFESDYWSMRMEDILVKYFYEYPNIEHTPLPEVDNDTPYILIPTDYVEIRRYWTGRDGGRAIKLKDGQGRRRKLFLNGILRRMINPSITFDNILYNLLYELVHYISNYDAENVISKKDIFNITRNVMKEDMSKYECLRNRPVKDERKPKKFIVNLNYCITHEVSKKKARALAAYMLGNGDKIGELYDCSLSDKKNLEVMKQHGLEVSLPTLKRWRAKHGITKYKKNAS